jgi:hypothetical protein
MTGRTRRLTLAVTLTAVALAGSAGLTACGGGGGDAPPNGVEKKPAKQVLKDAAAALKSSGSVHLTGSNRDSDGTTTVDLRLSGDNSTGTLVNADKKAKAKVIRTGGVTYIKANRAYYQWLKAPASVANTASDRWAKAPSDLSSGNSFTLASLADGIVGDLEVTTVRQGSLDGRKVVVLAGAKDGTTAYVANTGSPVPLRLEKGGRNPSRLDFGDYGEKVTIVAPRDAVTVPTTPST